ncbi:proline iminopeptidase-family hydrolase [Flavobacterium okayamense]|uniref:Proline iminopeptidase n=1 Tax=Flavobacterium okayamense TaxID=2830782 RepID=A0ABM7SDE5_9FLAO|nr:proline iminopeptidase-family hydrolase [Flavobacterium okayamense]BCY29236.1 proline iminopeptidase [Flavobacterium okayamense]
MKKITILLFILSIFTISCKQEIKETQPNVNGYFSKSEDSIQNGGIKVIPITTPKGTFNVWTKRIGNNPKIKVLLLNGGPGATHEYFECFENFLPAESIEFIYYDQLGCGNSDNPNDTIIWDLSRYVEEVEQVRKALKLDNSNFYLLGHSWGGILAMEYALKYQDNMKGMIISNMMSSCPEYDKYANEVLAKQMSPEVLTELMEIEANNDFSNPRYMELLLPNFYEKHILRFSAKDWPEPVNRSFAKMNQSLYVTMQGPSEFGIAGKLENWDRTEDLKKINIPTLVIGATHDTMDPKFMEKMSTILPNGSFLLCSKGSHMAFYDDQETYFKGLISFLKK